MPDTPQRIDLGTPALLEFTGPDAIRFLNGQLTQDVQLVASSQRALAACITDHKGKLQFRVWLHARGDAILVEGPEGNAADLEARLTRYLIADEVEVADLSGEWQLQHLIDAGADLPELPADALLLESDRFGSGGEDYWFRADSEAEALSDIPLLEGDALEALRIGRGIPAWGRELTEGLLPPEAGLEASDISYSKGCYIGQEVISRIKSAGMLNRRLSRIGFDAALPIEGLELVHTEGKPAGEITSVSPLPEGSRRRALGYLKRGVDSPQLRAPDGSLHPVELN